MINQLLNKASAESVRALTDAQKVSLLYICMGGYRSDGVDAFNNVVVPNWTGSSSRKKNELSGQVNYEMDDLPGFVRMSIYLQEIMPLRFGVLALLRTPRAEANVGMVAFDGPPQVLPQQERDDGNIGIDG
jgi:hypothetical protein